MRSETGTIQWMASRAASSAESPLVVARWALEAGSTGKSLAQSDGHPKNPKNPSPASPSGATRSRMNFFVRLLMVCGVWRVQALAPLGDASKRDRGLKVPKVWSTSQLQLLSGRGQFVLVLAASFGESMDLVI
jgi:hypothetical protein